MRHEENIINSWVAIMERTWRLLYFDLLLPATRAHPMQYDVLCKSSRLNTQLVCFASPETYSIQSQIT